MKKILLLSGLLSSLLLVPFVQAQTPASTATQNTPSQQASAIFAGGCFWCMEPPFDKIDGVISSISGYSGGKLKNPSYKQVSKGNTGHVEAIKIVYDPNKVTYEELLKVFWRNIDPTRNDGQFCDQGAHYRPVLFYSDATQKAQIEKSFQEINAIKTFPEALKVDVLPEKNFYPAEEYHQNYYLKNPLRYKYYRYSCGRDKKLKKLWGNTDPK